ncbi:FHA domain-containing protein [Streptomyces sp. NBC_01471]|uniref:FHA domain-containing protein n=1 Tax=Streptomyces sp. NBC_01471 TaxID=2903879 RepID=UPI00324B5D8B
MPTCPNGHQSGSDDWCEVCGHRMGAVPPPPPPPPPYAGGGAPQQPPPGRSPAAGYGYPPGATAQAEICPQCRTPREAGAPFCEECRWNFLTNTATSYTPVAPNLPPGLQSQQPPPRPPDAFDYQSSRPSQINRPAEPLTNAPTGRPVPPPPPPAYQQQSAPPPPSFAQPPRAPQAPRPAEQPNADDWLLPPPSQTQPPGQGRPQGPGQQDPGQQGPGQPHGPGRQGPGRQAPPQHQPPQQFQPPQSQPHQPQPHQQSQQGPGHQGSGPQGPGQQAPGQQSHPGRPGQPAGEAQAPAGWSVTVGPDHEYFMAMMQRSGPEATGLNLPAYSPEQRLPLTGNQITIGRRRHSTGESPDIDLSVPPEDPGVSHQHAVLVQQPDNSWAVVDQNSTNGTTVNGAEDPIQPYVPIPLAEGDRVHVGAWTTLTVHRGQ